MQTTLMVGPSTLATLLKTSFIDIVSQYVVGPCCMYFAMSPGSSVTSSFSPPHSDPSLSEELVVPQCEVADCVSPFFDVFANCCSQTHVFAFVAQGSSGKVALSVFVAHPMESWPITMFLRPWCKSLKRFVLCRRHVSSV